MPYSDVIPCISLWPFFVYMITLSIFPVASACSHAFNVLSIKARHICFFIDYYAICLFVVGSSIAYVCYALPCTFIAQKDFQAIFVYGSLLISFVSLNIACQTRFVPCGKIRKILRFSAFALPYIYLNIPVIYRILLLDKNDSPFEIQAKLHYSRHFIWAVISGLLYTSHAPECLFPGRFDIVGHSHQLFHLCSALGVREQFLGLWNDAISSRKQCFSERTILAGDDLPVIFGSMGILIVAIISGLLVIILYIRQLCAREHNCYSYPGLNFSHQCMMCIKKYK